MDAIAEVYSMSRSGHNAASYAIYQNFPEMCWDEIANNFVARGEQFLRLSPTSGQQEGCTCGVGGVSVPGSCIGPDTSTQASSTTAATTTTTTTTTMGSTTRGSFSLCSSPVSTNPISYRFSWFHFRQLIFGAVSSRVHFQ